MTATAEHLEATHDDAAHHSDWLYIKVAIWLAVLTGIEVFTYFESVHNWPDWFLRVTLIFLMVIKFGLVAAYFMHLKFDNPILTKIFVAGMCVALPVYFVMAFSAEFLLDWHWAIKVAMVVGPPILGAAFFGFKSAVPDEPTAAGH